MVIGLCNKTTNESTNVQGIVYKRRITIWKKIVRSLNYIDTENGVKTNCSLLNEFHKSIKELIFYYIFAWSIVIPFCLILSLLLYFIVYIVENMPNIYLLLR
jgi:hypothetical protein